MSRLRIKYVLAGALALAAAFVVALVIISGGTGAASSGPSRPPQQTATPFYVRSADAPKPADAPASGLLLPPYAASPSSPSGG